MVMVSLPSPVSPLGRGKALASTVRPNGSLGAPQLLTFDGYFLRSNLAGLRFSAYMCPQTPQTGLAEASLVWSSLFRVAPLQDAVSPDTCGRGSFSLGGRKQIAPPCYGERIQVNDRLHLP